MKSTSKLLTLIILLSALGQAQGNEVRPYYAEYRGEYQGLPVKAKGVRELIQREDGSYQLTSSASAMFMKVSEVTNFELINGIIVPQNYQYQRSMMGKKKAEQVRFDWNAGLASHEDTTSTLEPGTLDKLSYQVQLRLDVARALETSNTDKLEYTIADEEKRKQYQFSFIGEQTLTTPLGELRTIAVQRQREDRNRRTTVWLALDHDLLLVRLKQEQPDSGFELNLKNFRFLDNVEVPAN